MATIRRSGSGWQALIRRKNHVGPRSKTFPSEYLARCWAEAVEESAADKKTGKIPITLKDAIVAYINGPLLEHRSADNERYSLQAMASSWIGDIPLKLLEIRHLATWRDEKLLKVKPNTVMRELRIIRVLIDWVRDERGAEIIANPARSLKVRGTGDARMPFFTRDDERRLLNGLRELSNPEHLKLTKLALMTGFRRSELLSMNWENIDRNRSIIHLKRKNCAAVHNSGEVRIAPITDGAMKFLRGFKNKNGKVLKLTKGSARYGFDKARRSAGLTNLRFHDLRHIAISRMWSDGMNALQISACSGHRDLKMLMRYSHYQLSLGH